jgi:uncharacterized protein YfaP (DUF2135 family)
MNDNKIFSILAVLAMCVLCGFSILAVEPQKTTSEIEMVQPCGWFWCAAYDAQYAEHVNEPNSRANLNNAQASAYDAIADKMRAEESLNRLAILGGYLLMAVGFGVVFLIGVGAAYAVSKKSP